MDKYFTNKKLSWILSILLSICLLISMISRAPVSLIVTASYTPPAANEIVSFTDNFDRIANTNNSDPLENGWEYGNPGVSAGTTGLLSVNLLNNQLVLTNRANGIGEVYTRRIMRPMSEARLNQTVNIDFTYESANCRPWLFLRLQTDSSNAKKTEGYAVSLNIGNPGSGIEFDKIALNSDQSGVSPTNDYTVHTRTPLGNIMGAGSPADYVIGNKYRFEFSTEAIAGGTTLIARVFKIDHMTGNLSQIGIDRSYSDTNADNYALLGKAGAAGVSLQNTGTQTSFKVDSFSYKGFDPPPPEGTVSFTDNFDRIANTNNSDPLENGWEYGNPGVSAGTTGLLSVNLLNNQLVLTNRANGIGEVYTRRIMRPMSEARLNQTVNIDFTYESANCRPWLFLRLQTDSGNAKKTEGYAVSLNIGDPGSGIEFDKIALNSDQSGAIPQNDYTVHTRTPLGNIMGAGSPADYVIGNKYRFEFSAEAIEGGTTLTARVFKVDQTTGNLSQIGIDRSYSDTNADNYALLGKAGTAGVSLQNTGAQTSFKVDSFSYKGFDPEVLREEYYVVPETGNDITGDGSESAPFATLSRVIKEAGDREITIFIDGDSVYENIPTHTSTITYKGKTSLDSVNFGGTFLDIKGPTIFENITVGYQGGYYSLGSGSLTLEGSQVVYGANIALDFSTLSCPEVKGKVFIGWKLSDTNTYAVNKQTYPSGTTIIAAYEDWSLDYAGDFHIVGAQVKTGDTQGLRYIIEKQNHISDTLDIMEYGAIVLPTDALDALGDWAFKIGDTYLSGTKSYSPFKVVGENIYEKYSDKTRFTVCINGITSENYCTQFSVRGYIKYTDFNGVERTTYTSTNTTTVFDTAKQFLNDSDSLSTSEILALEAIVYNVKEGYLGDATPVKYYENGYPYDNWLYRIPSEDGTMMSYRDVTYDLGTNEGKKAEIIQLTDLHINYFNTEDESNPTLMSTKQERKWLANGASIPSIKKALRYASLFDQTVITGDVLDVLSSGALELTQKYIWDVDPSVMIAPGNHEYDQKVTGSVPEIYTQKERVQMVKDFWKHDPGYYSRLVKDKVLCVTIDNAQNFGDGIGYRYLEGQQEKLEHDIKFARDNGCIILLFQHIPLVTGNSADQSLSFINNSVMGASSTNINFYNPPNSSDVIGGANSTEICKNMYDLITSSADVIKGVFTGHLHGDYTMEINANANGQPATIPQYVLTGNPYPISSTNGGQALKITVEW